MLDDNRDALLKDDLQALFVEVQRVYRMRVLCSSSESERKFLVKDKQAVIKALKSVERYLGVDE